MADERGFIRTATLLRRLFKAPNLKAFIDGELREVAVPTFREYISDLCLARGEVAERVINRAGIERTYGHQLFNGTRKPSRDKVLQLALGFELDVDGAQRLLRVARKSALYPKLDRDAAILYCIHHRLTVIETQGLLHQLGLTLLGGDEQHG